MPTPTSWSWPVILALGGFALLRPSVSIVADQAGLTSAPVVSIALTIVITAVWVLVVGLSRVGRPVLTLVLVGLVYAVLSILLSAILSPILSGELQGPLATPVAIIPVLVTNAAWGAIAGLLALAVRRLRRSGSEPSATGSSLRD